MSGVYRKTSRAIFVGLLLVFSVISWVVLDWLDLTWNIWVQFGVGLGTLVLAIVLSRWIPRWVGVERD